MRRYLSSSIVFLLFSLHSTCISASVSSQVLMKGQSTTISVDYEVGDVALADPSVCDYLVGSDRRSLYINGRGNGETTITLWDSAGTQRDEFAVRVVTATLKEVLDSVRDEFGNLNGIDIYVRDGRVEIGGEVVEPDDFKRIESVAQKEPMVKSRVRLADEIIGRIVSAIREEIDIPGVTVESVRDRVVLGGVAYSSTDKARAVEIAKLYYPDVLDLIDVSDSKRHAGRGSLVELEFHVMEIKRSALRQLGINWAPGSLPSGGSSNAGFGSSGLFQAVGDMGRSVLGFVFQLVPKLRLIRERGDGRVLENPSIVVKSGEVAKIFSGSEVPYYRNDEVQFKKVGIEIEAEPIELKDGVDLKIQATLSAPSADIRGAVDTHTVATTAICPFGQSLVLGNIIRNGDVKMKNRVPRDVDTSSALFTLFLSKDFQSNRSEFVVFVTPKMVKQPAAADARLKDFFLAEEAMMRDRSKKEYEGHISKHLKGDGVREGGKKNRRGRRWR